MAEGLACDHEVFEGSEKRLELVFRPHAAGGSTQHDGLRKIKRITLDKLMAAAGCEIVSHMASDELDAYVLSESSLFVYPRAWIIKTCGTTQLLNCLPDVIAEAEALALQLQSVKYSRASYLFPVKQPAAYQTFSQEVALLRSALGHPLSTSGSAHVLGDPGAGLQWHVFTATRSTGSSVPQRTGSALSADSSQSCSSDVAFDDDCAPLQSAFHPRARGIAVPAAACDASQLTTLEVCMTELSERAAAHFVRSEAFVSGAHATEAAGIRALTPAAKIDDFLFEPCGYSMNGVDGRELMTIHVTPEAGFSYASCEMHVSDGLQCAAAAATQAIVAIFQPRRFVVARTYQDAQAAADAAVTSSEALNVRWDSKCSSSDALHVPGYRCLGTDSVVLAGGGTVVHDCFEYADDCDCSS